MAARRGRDMTVEEFDAWSKARANFAAIREAGGEEGGPHLSLVPLPDGLRYAEATELVGGGLAAEPLPNAVPFDPQPSRRRYGWSAMRQRIFIESLAESGSVHLSAKDAGLSVRSAYALRLRSPAFAAAWDAGQQLAVGRLSALAFDRAIHGRTEQLYRDGDLIQERRAPSDKLLMWLLARLDPKRFALPWERAAGEHDPQAEAARALPALLAALDDTPQDALEQAACIAPAKPDETAITVNIGKIGDAPPALATPLAGAAPEMDHQESSAPRG